MKNKILKYVIITIVSLIISLVVLYNLYWFFGATVSYKPIQMADFMKYDYLNELYNYYFEVYYHPSRFIMAYIYIALIFTITFILLIFKKHIFNYFKKLYLKIKSKTNSAKIKELEKEIALLKNKDQN